MAGRKVFTSGEILTSADVNSFLMDQSVMVFADDDARSSAIPSPSEGMVTYLKDEDEVTVFDGSVFKAVGPGKILQVVYASKTNILSSSSSSFVNIGLSATITPSSPASKILVSTNVQGSSTDSSDSSGQTRQLRDGTVIHVGDAAGSRTRTSGGAFSSRAGPRTNVYTASWEVLDSPSTTSAVVYSVQCRSGSAGSFLINHARVDSTNGGLSARGVSSITLMEVAG